MSQSSPNLCTQPAYHYCAATCWLPVSPIQIQLLYMCFTCVCSVCYCWAV